MPEPLAIINDKAKKPPGKWTDEQKLTLETFKEIVAADIENVWVFHYLGSIFRADGDQLTDIKVRITAVSTTVGKM